MEKARNAVSGWASAVHARGMGEGGVGESRFNRSDGLHGRDHGIDDFEHRSSSPKPFQDSTLDD